MLLQYYSVLQSTTPLLLCTTKYYSSTTSYYKVLLQYYKVLLCTTKYNSSTSLYYSVHSSTTKYNSSTSPYYKVLLHYYSELQSTTPVLPCTTKNYSWLILDIWSVVYNAQNNKSHPATPKNTARAMQNESHDWSASHMKRHLQCAEQQESSSNFTKCCACHAKWILWLIRITCIWKVIYNARSNKTHPPASPKTAPATQHESHDWSALHLKRHLQCAEQQESSFNFTKDCACHATWTSWLIRITFETSFTMRGATRVILQLRQRLRLPRNMNLMIDPHHIWNVIYTARSNRHHPLTSPNFVPATQNDRPTSDRNLLKTAVKDHFQRATDPSPFRAWSETVPSMIRPWKRKPQPASPPRILFALARSRCYWKLQHACLAPAILQISPNAAPATKSDTWTSPNAAPATKSDTWTHPNARIDERLGPRPGPSRRACNLKTSGGGYLRRPPKATSPDPTPVQMQQLFGTYFASQICTSEACMTGNRHTANLPSLHRDTCI